MDSQVGPEDLNLSIWSHSVEQVYLAIIIINVITVYALRASVAERWRVEKGTPTSVHSLRKILKKSSCVYNSWKQRTLICTETRTLIFKIDTIGGIKTNSLDPQHISTQRHDLLPVQ